MKKLILLLCAAMLIVSLIGCSKKNISSEAIREKYKDAQMMTVMIDDIEKGYFLGMHPFPSVPKYKVYGSLGKEFCKGDYVDVYYKESKTKDQYEEIQALGIIRSDFKPEADKAYKPVIYLYPTAKAQISVKLDYNGVLTHTYPAYDYGWNVTAYPNGVIIDGDGEQYPYLFWEGVSKVKYDMSMGFCVEGNKTEQFLKDKLSYMGLNKKELQEFISFWVPIMKNNPYNKICFQYSNYIENAKLTINPKPDSLLRIYMAYQPLDHYVKMKEQSLATFERKGFAVVEWGGGVVEE